MGLPEGTPVIAGMSDIPAAATGSGALEDGDAHVYLGTSSWLCLSHLEAEEPAEKRHSLGCVSRPGDVHHDRRVRDGRDVPGVVRGQPGGADEWERARGAGWSIFEVLDEVAAGVEPGARGLLFMPWMFGERAPVTDTTLRGAFANLSLEHRREHMLRSIYEGVAYNLRWMMDEVEKRGLAAAGRCEPSAGGARSDTWMTVLADATGRRVEAMADPQEAGALGVALAVAVGLGIFSDYKQIKNVLKVHRTFEPDPATRPTYDTLYSEFRALYPHLSKSCRRLNARVGPMSRRRRTLTIRITPSTMTITTLHIDHILYIWYFPPFKEEGDARWTPQRSARSSRS